MKNLILIALLSCTWIVESCAQNKSSEKTPEIVLSAFNQKFPDAKKVEWEMENESEWEAEFKMNGIEYSSNFSIDGEWRETEIEIKTSNIPADIKAMLDENFTDYEIEKAEIAETPSGKSYEFELEMNEEEFEVVIDALGTLTRKDVAKEEGDNEDEENDED